MTEQEFASAYEVGFADVQEHGIVVIMVRLFAILTGAVDRVRKARSTATVGVKKAVEMVSANAETVEAASGLADQVRSLIFTAIQGNPDLSVLLPDHFSIVIDEIRDVRRLVMAGLDIEDDQESPDVSADVIAARIAADTLRKYGTIMGMQGENLDSLPAAMVRKNKKDETLLSLPKVPSDSDSDDESPSSTSGRPVQGGKFAFHLNGKPVPVSGFDRLAVFYCSTATSRINGPELKDLIKKQTGKEWSDKENEKFTVTVPAGTLVGTLETAKN
jgi:hypothetical protein